jgi:2-iminobutanoate/2-iminopropanoate deaminase
VGTGEVASCDDSVKSLPATSKGRTARYSRISTAFSKEAGGKLADMVQMTVFISDVRYGDHLTQIRRETFGDNFPGSAFIRPRILTQKLRFMVMP